jgi:hypothetical protein
MDKRSMEREIKQLSIVIIDGIRTYQINDEINGSKITKIVLGELYFNGDPFDHYIGYNEKGGMIFSVSCLCPCDVVYIIKP